MRLRTSFFVFFVCIVIFCGRAEAQHFLYYEDLQKFKTNNPDGNKYEFVSDYIESLNYLRLSKTRQVRMEDDLTKKSGRERINKMIDNLVLDNLNLRVSRNILKKHQDPFNGLMLKASDLFINMCNEQIKLNNQERKRLTELYRSFEDEEAGSVDQEEFLRFQERLAAERKESSKKLLEASYLVAKVLISNKEDEYGELIYLGVTTKQRDKLLRKLDSFQGAEFRGEVRPGQSFLEASVSALRENLEDYSWAALDE